VCRAASCSNGVVTASATCGGATSCPSSTTSDCFGACDANGLTCQDTAPVKVEDVYSTLATDNDAGFLYTSNRSQAGVSQIVRYSKTDFSKVVLFESTNPGEWIYAFTVVNGYVYLSETFWTGVKTTPDAGQVSLITTTGVKQAPTSVQGVSTFGFAKNSTNVYWSDGSLDACFCANPPQHHVYTT